MQPVRIEIRALTHMMTLREQKTWRTHVYPLRPISTLSGTANTGIDLQPQVRLLNLEKKDDKKTLIFSTKK